MSDISPDLIRSLSSLGATGVLTVILWLFVRGDILSRLVYERMTVTIIEQVVTEVSSSLAENVKEMLTDWETDSARREANVHWELSKLQHENQQLVEEMEWDNPTMQKEARVGNGE